MIKTALRVAMIACFQVASIGFAIGVFMWARYYPEPWKTTVMFISFGIFFGNAWLVSQLFFWGTPKPVIQAKQRGRA